MARVSQHHTTRANTDTRVCLRSYVTIMMLQPENKPVLPPGFMVQLAAGSYQSLLKSAHATLQKIYRYMYVFAGKLSSSETGSSASCFL